MEFRARLQLSEALGEVNRWYCSESHGKEITDHESLMRYYIRNGGAANFAVRFEQAMGHLNRWYCSEQHGHEIRDPEVLWRYYMAHV